MIDAIQRQAFNYFIHETNLANGLVVDTTRANAPSSIAAVGLGLTAAMRTAIAEFAHVVDALVYAAGFPESALPFR